MIRIQGCHNIKNLNVQIIQNCGMKEHQKKEQDDRQRHSSVGQIAIVSTIQSDKLKESRNNSQNVDNIQIQKNQETNVQELKQRPKAPLHNQLRIRKRLVQAKAENVEGQPVLIQTVQDHSAKPSIISKPRQSSHNEKMPPINQYKQKFQINQEIKDNYQTEKKYSLERRKIKQIVEIENEVHQIQNLDLYNKHSESREINMVNKKEILRQKSRNNLLVDSENIRLKDSLVINQNLKNQQNQDDPTNLQSNNQINPLQIQNLKENEKTDQFYQKKFQASQEEYTRGSTISPNFRDIKNNIGIIEKIQTGCIEIESPNKNIKIHSTTIKNRKVYSLTRKSKIVQNETGKCGQQINGQNTLFVSERDKILELMEKITNKQYPQFQGNRKVGGSPQVKINRKIKVQQCGFLISVLDAVNQDKRNDGFINPADHQYLKSYAVENLIDCLNREKKCLFNNHMNNQIYIQSLGRAQMIDNLFQVAQALKIDDKQIVYCTATLIDQFYNQKNIQAKPFADIFLTGYTSLFIASKNSEVQPLSLSDVKTYLLKNNYSREQILQKETDIRKACGYENDFVTLFEYLMIYIKIWKINCQLVIKDPTLWFFSTHQFLCDVETACYDFTKSVLIDSQSLKFKPSIIVPALITCTLEISLRKIYEDKINSGIIQNAADEQKNLPVLDHLKICNSTWDRVAKKIFGKDSIQHLENFGRFLILRQQRIFKIFKGNNSSNCELKNIYKERCQKFYTHSYFQSYILSGFQQEDKKQMIKEIGQSQVEDYNKRINEDTQKRQLKQSAFEPIVNWLLQKDVEQSIQWAQQISQTNYLKKQLNSLEDNDCIILEQEKSKQSMKVDQLKKEKKQSLDICSSQLLEAFRSTVKQNEFLVIKRQAIDYIIKK